MYSFRKYQPLTLRIWHWLNMTMILGLLATVLLRKTFLSWRTNSALIESKLREAGQIITPELAKDIAVTIRSPLWEWHINLGFALAALLLFRIFVALLVEKSCPGVHAIKLALGIKDLPRHERKDALHFTAVKLGYAAFYLATIIMIATGFTLYFKGALGLSKDILATVHEIHELLMWFFVVFAVGHFLGVVIAENRKDGGLTSDMIHGGDRR